MNARSQRAAQRDTFLKKQNLADATVVPLPPDASFRCYFRIVTDKMSKMLMDAPPPEENVRPYIKVARHLKSMGLRAPEIYASDDSTGFVLHEDFGDNTFTRLLTNPSYQERDLYELATDVLIEIHRHENATNLNVPAYSRELLLEEAARFSEWYLPVITGISASPDIVDSWTRAWTETFDSLTDIKDCLVLRDYHVDNLMICSDMQNKKPGIEKCGLLDFQDAVIGNPAYDLVSLLEDARRDIPGDIQASIIERYKHAWNTIDPQTDFTAFLDWYRVLGAQRHAKIIGTFVRLSRRDGKDNYLKHIPRVLRLLDESLQADCLHPIRQWCEKYLTRPLPELPRQPSRDSIISK